MNLLFDQNSFAKPPERHYKKISDSLLRQMGVSREGLQKVRTLDELRHQTPNIVIATSLKNSGFIQNNFKLQKFKKKINYVMSLGVFQQLHFEPTLNQKLLKPAEMKFSNIYRPYIGQDLTNKTILVWRTGGIGDLLFIQPNLRFLKEKYPTCNIKFACGPQYQAMVETWDCIDELLDLPFSVSHFLQSDYHVIFEGVIERTEQAEHENAYRLFTQWMGLNLPDELLVPKQDVKEDILIECRKIIQDEFNLNDKEFLLVQARASSPIRSPRPTFWSNVVDTLTDEGYKIIMTDLPQHSEGIDNFISKACKNPNSIFNFSKFSKTLDYTIALTKLSNIVIGTDSALMHIAASLDTKAFGIYGPFPGSIRLETYPKVDWIDAKTDCGPCFKHGHLPCENSTLGFSKCYDQIDMEELLNKIKDLDND